MADNLSVKI